MLVPMDQVFFLSFFWAFIYTTSIDVNSSDSSFNIPPLNKTFIILSTKGIELVWIETWWHVYWWQNSKLANLHLFMSFSSTNKYYSLITIFFLRRYFLLVSLFTFFHRWIFIWIFIKQLFFAFYFKFLSNWCLSAIENMSNCCY